MNSQYWKKRALELEKQSFLSAEQLAVNLKISYYRISHDIKEQIKKIDSKLQQANTDDMGAYIYRQKALKELRSNIRNEYRDLLSKEYEQSAKHYNDVIKNTYDGIARSVKGGTSFSMLKSDDVKKLLQQKWADSNYSKRIWKNVNSLGIKVSNIVLDGLVSGKSINQMSRELERATRVGTYNTERLIRTETNYFYNQSTLKAYKDYGITKYKFLASIDGRTSKICEELNGSIFDVDKSQVGENYPPMHPFCRSTVVPYFDDEGLQNDGDGGTILSDEEQYAVNTYISSGSYILNEKLRRGLGLFDEEKTMTRNLDSVLDRIPTFKGKLYRTLDLKDEKLVNFLEQHQQGKTVNYDSYTSTSTKKGYNDKANIYINIKNSQKGKDFRQFNKAESEVLYKRGSKFQVISANTSDNKYYIELKEID